MFAIHTSWAKSGLVWTKSGLNATSARFERTVEVLPSRCVRPRRRSRKIGKRCAAFQQREHSRHGQDRNTRPFFFFTCHCERPNHFFFFCHGLHIRGISGHRGLREWFRSQRSTLSCSPSSTENSLQVIQLFAKRISGCTVAEGYVADIKTKHNAEGVELRLHGVLILLLKPRVERFGEVQ